MSVIADVVAIVESNWGWFVVLAFLAYQLYCPQWVNETKLQSIINRYDQKFNEIDNKQVTLTQVVRAMARVMNEGDSSIDIKQVDEYLVRNGVEVEDFITANEDTDELEDTDETEK